MMSKLNHTHHTLRNKLLNLQLHPSPPILYLEQTMCVSNPKMTLHEHAIQSLHVILGEVLFIFVHLSTPVVGAVPFYLNDLALCITQFRSLGVNPTETSPTYKYVITSASSWMSKALLPLNSTTSYWDSPLPMLLWDTYLRCPNMVHKYVEAYHLGTASKSISPC